MSKLQEDERRESATESDDDSASVDDDAAAAAAVVLGSPGRSRDDPTAGDPGTTAETSRKSSPVKGADDDKNDILKFTMLINKCNSDLGMKRNWKTVDEAQERYKKDVKCTMFFNKEVTIRSNVDITSPLTVRSLEPAYRDSSSSSSSKQPVRSNHRSDPDGGSPTQTSQHRDLDLLAPGSASFSDFTDRKLKCGKKREAEISKKFLTKSAKIDGEPVQVSFHPDLRLHNSLTSLVTQNLRLGLRGVLKSKIPSMTSIETHSKKPNKISYWDHWKCSSFLTDVNRCLNLQLSKSTDDSNRRSSVKLKKDDAVSVSDSRLFHTDARNKTRQVHKKCDKKSRGDNTWKKDRDSAGGRKQVQWKTEVEVIYFSSRLTANGHRTDEVIGRVMEPLREEWEQQRKGFYAKMIPYHMEIHLKDHFISLLKI